MSTQIIPPVSVTLTNVPKSVVKQGEKRASKVVVEDSLEILSDPSLAPAAEPHSPPKGDKNKHASLQASREELKACLKQLGSSTKGDLGDLAEKHLAKLDVKLMAQQKDQKDQKDGKGAGVAEIKVEHNKLTQALRDYRSSLAESLNPSDEPEEGKKGVKSQGVKEASSTPAEQNLWMEAAKVSGLANLSSSRDVTTLQKVAKEASKSLEVCKTQETDLQNKIQQVKTALKAATQPEAKKTLQQQLEGLQKQLNDVFAKKEILAKKTASLSDVTDKIVVLTTKKDLGLTFKTASLGSEDPVLEKKAGSKGSPANASNGTKTLGPSSTSRYTPASQDGNNRSGGLLGVASVGGGASDEDLSSPSSLSNTPALTIANDNTGTLLSINTVGSNIKSQSQKNEKALKALLDAAMNGNWEAVKSALIILGQNSSLAVTKMGAIAIKSMQSYEKQMDQISQSMGSLSGSDPAYSSKLAQLNSNMNQLSIKRQSIADFLRSMMDMKEQVMGLTDSILKKDSQLGSMLSR